MVTRSSKSNSVCLIRNSLTQHGVLRQAAVADGVGSLVGPQVVHGHADTFVHLLVMKNMMTVAVKQEWQRAEKVIERLLMTQNNNISFIHSSSELSTEIYSTAGRQAAREQNWIQRLFTRWRTTVYDLHPEACQSVSGLTRSNVVHMF